MKIQSIQFNWSGIESYGFFDEYEVGKKGVKSITAHSAQGEGDKWYWTVEFDDGRNEMIFNINSVKLIP